MKDLSRGSSDLWKIFLILLNSILYWFFIDDIQACLVEGGNLSGMSQVMGLYWFSQDFFFFFSRSVTHYITSLLHVNCLFFLWPLNCLNGNIIKGSICIYSPSLLLSWYLFLPHDIWQILILVSRLILRLCYPTHDFKSQSWILELYDEGNKEEWGLIINYN
jgi:hypothetical protein